MMLKFRTYEQALQTIMNETSFEPPRLKSDNFLSLVFEIGVENNRAKKYPPRHLSSLISLPISGYFWLLIIIKQIYDVEHEKGSAGNQYVTFFGHSRS